MRRAWTDSETNAKSAPFQRSILKNSPKGTLMYKPFVRTFASAGLFLVALSAHGQPYSLTDLGSPGGNQTTATGLNARGQAVGWSELADGSSHAFLYSNGSMQDLETFSGGSDSAANAINRHGQVAGDSYTAQGAEHAFLYSGGSLQDLGTLGGNDSQANGINGHGQVVGWSGLAGVPEFGPSGSVHAFLYSNGSMQDLGTLNGGAYSQATAVNAHGRVVGWSDTSSGQHAFLYSHGSMQDLGTIGGSGSASQANGINRAGQVVGWSYVGTTNSYHAFLYSNGNMQDLGTLAGATFDSQANAINTRGQIVGWSDTDAFGSPQHAFLYSNGTMVDLNILDTSSPLASYVTLYSATGINDRGWIVANGVDSRTGEAHAYLLIPLASHG